MKKISIYSFLVASVLLTGCSQKEAEVQVNKDVVKPVVVEDTTSKSETALNTIPDTNVKVMDGSFSGGERAEGGVYYTINGQRVFIENIYFGFDQYNLNSAEKAKAMSNANKLSALNSAATVKVTGNTDEWGTDEYNYALGLKRAKAVKEVLVNNGVNANVSLISLGESNPACTASNQNCWSKNRRVEHSLTK